VALLNAWKGKEGMGYRKAKNASKSNQLIRQQGEREQ
jgi:hypothetical protein